MAPGRIRCRQSPAMRVLVDAIDARPRPRPSTNCSAPGGQPAGAAGRGRLASVWPVWASVHAPAAIFFARTPCASPWSTSARAPPRCWPGPMPSRRRCAVSFSSSAHHSATSAASITFSGSSTFGCRLFRLPATPARRRQVQAARGTSVSEVERGSRRAPQTPSSPADLNHRVDCEARPGVLLSTGHKLRLATPKNRSLQCPHALPCRPT